MSGDRVSTWGDEKVLEWVVVLLNVPLNVAKMGRFLLRTFTTIGNCRNRKEKVSGCPREEVGVSFAVLRGPGHRMDVSWPWESREAFASPVS